MDYVVHGATKSQTRLSGFHFTPLLKEIPAYISTHLLFLSFICDIISFFFFFRKLTSPPKLNFKSQVTVYVLYCEFVPKGQVSEFS